MGDCCKTQPFLHSGASMFCCCLSMIVPASLDGVGAADGGISGKVDDQVEGG